MIVLLSYPITGRTPLFPGTAPVELGTDDGPERPTPVSTVVRFNAHSGTHIDAPRHFCPLGLTVQEAIGPINEYATVLCLDVPAEGTMALTEGHLPHMPASHQVDGVLIRTGTHRRRADAQAYSADHPFLTSPLTRHLVEWFPRLRILGIDCVSLAHPDHVDEGAEVHRALLCRDRPILILEDMDLSYNGLARTSFRLIVVPVLHDRLDGTPAVVLAILPDPWSEEQVVQLEGGKKDKERDGDDHGGNSRPGRPDPGR
ncbi:MAG: cyclase family protein [Methanomassiliicoccus sp.]|nr:cyclase family protein [Methanomassiliicoccus sp.]